MIPKTDHTFLRKGKLLKVYTDGRWDYSMSVEDALKIANALKDACRATGPVSTKITQIAVDLESIDSSDPRLTK
jgi:hypothetical protein